MSPLATVPELLARAEAFPDTGLRFLDRREDATWWSWPQIAAAARRVAGGLRAAGISRGERVALVYPTCPELVFAFFGVLEAGAVPVPLYPPVRLGRLDEYHRRTAALLDAAGARLMLAERRVRRLLGRTVAGARLELGCATLDGLPSGPPPEHRPEPDELALVQFSSGTTVEPKPVALSHRAVLAQTRTLNSFWPDDRGVVHSGVSWLPLYHDMGLIGCLFPAVERPGTLTLIGPEVFVARPAVWLRAISRYRATLSPAPNFAYGLCVDKIADDELDGVDLGSWRVALNGAEPIAPGVLRRFQERFARWGLKPEALTPVYGLSEASLAVTFSDLGKPFRTARFDRDELSAGRVRTDDDGVELVSLGRPLPGFELRFEDGDGDGRVGRLWVRGPSLMSGYLGRPEATAAALRDGWLDTGDLGFLHHGELYLTGRAKDVVILRGRNHAPSEIEHALDGVAGTRKGCAVAVSHLPEGADGEELLLFVERAKDARPEDDLRLATTCGEAVLAATGLAVGRCLVLEPGTLPRTSSGKLRRGETLRRHLAGELEPPQRVTPLLLGGALARSALAYAGGKKKRGA